MRTKRYGKGIFINKYNFDYLCHLPTKTESLYSSGTNVILRLLMEGQINISVKYEIFNDTKQQESRTTSAPEQRLLAVNNSLLNQLSFQSNRSCNELHSVAMTKKMLQLGFTTENCICLPVYLSESCWFSCTGNCTMTLGHHLTRTYCW